MPRPPQSSVSGKSLVDIKSAEIVAGLFALWRALWSEQNLILLSLPVAVLHNPNPLARLGRNLVAAVRP